MTRKAFAVGFSVHTGWAAGVLVGGSARELTVDARERVELFEGPERFVFHRAALLSLDAGRGSLASARKLARSAARAAIGRFVEHAERAGGRLVAGAVVAKAGAPPGSLQAIVSAHPRIHAAEGFFYRDALLHAAEAKGIAARVVPPREVEVAASEAVGGRADPKRLLAAAGRDLGPPWGKDQRLAALAAWGALLAAG